VRIDRTRKLPLTVLVRALGYGTDLEITELFGEDERILATIQKDSTKTEEEGLLEIYKRLRPGEPPTVESAKALLHGLFSTLKGMIWQSREDLNLTKSFPLQQEYTAYSR